MGTGGNAHQGIGAQNLKMVGDRQGGRRAAGREERDAAEEGKRRRGQGRKSCVCMCVERANTEEENKLERCWPVIIFPSFCCLRYQLSISSLLSLLNQTFFSLNRPASRSLFSFYLSCPPIPPTHLLQRRRRRHHTTPPSTYILTTRTVFFSFPPIRPPTPTHTHTHGKVK